MTHYSEHLTLKPKKKLFIETVLWECIVSAGLDTLESDAGSAFEDANDFVSCCLQGLERIGYVVGSKDEKGNFIFEPTPALLSKLGKSPGPLQWCGYLRHNTN